MISKCFPYLITFSLPAVFDSKGRYNLSEALGSNQELTKTNGRIEVVIVNLSRLRILESDTNYYNKIVGSQLRISLMIMMIGHIYKKIVPYFKVEDLLSILSS